MRTTAPLQLGRKSPDEQPARDTRYQDIRLYARALTAEEAKRLPFEDYVAEITSRPMSQWDRDQWHAVSEFYFANVDESAKAMQQPDSTAGCRTRQAFRGRRHFAGGARKSRPWPMRMF